MPFIALLGHAPAPHRARRRFWNGEKFTLANLGPRFAMAANQQPQPELHIRADRNARYESVATVMSAAAKAGLTRIGFVTDPGGS